MNISGIDLRHLRYFIAVAEELHFGRAARRLNISQPPLSQQIMALEDYLGTKLFVRTRRHVALSPAGAYLLPHARTLTHDLARFAQLAHEAQNGLSGQLRLGLNYSAPFHPVTTRLLQAFHKKYPGIRLELVLHEQDNLLRLADLESAQLDLALIWLDDDYQSRRLHQLDLAHDPLQVTLPKCHPLASRKQISIRDLRELPLIAQPRHAGTQRYDAIFRAYASIGAEPRIVYEALQMPLVMSMVAAGQGISLLPAFLAGLPIDGVVFRPLQLPKGHAPCMTYRLVMPRQSQNPAATHFFELAKGLAAPAKIGPQRKSAKETA